MGKMTKKQIADSLKSDEPIDYNKLRLDVLKNSVESRNIECKQTKEEMVKYLVMDDNDKYIRPIIYTKHADGYMVGIDLRDSNNLIEMGKLVEKNIAYRMNLYSNDRIHYISKQKLL